jgi:hypothetical protein
MARRLKIQHRELLVLALIALGRLLIHCLTNHRYGFHRDELGVLDDARYPDLGYVSYPPFTPFVAHVALTLFGPSLVGLRFFTALAQSVAMVFTGLMARELGGGRSSQAISAVAAAISPMAVCMGTMFQYIGFDYLWWVMAAWCFIRLLRTENPRWWLAMGAILGLGMITKYTMIFFIAGICAGVLSTSARRYLKSPWLWAGVGLSLLIFLPNLLWQIQHHFISLTFLKQIHQRDVEIGRTDDFLLLQLLISANLVTLPLWLAGLWFYFISPEGRTYRAIGWMFVIPLLLFLIARGRFYYMAPAYPMLLAAGSVVWCRWLDERESKAERAGSVLTWTALALGALVSVAVMMPLAPINSAGWRLTSKIHDNFREQIGWPDLTETVARIYAAIPQKEKTRTAILAGNYGEAGALNLYGRSYQLPEAISGMNSYWLRGYGPQSPELVILIGYSRQSAERLARDVQLAGHITNSYGVANEEATDHPDIFLCRKFRKPWPELWKELLHFGWVAQSHDYLNS